MGTVWRAQFLPAPDDDAAGVRAAIVGLLDTLVAEMSHWQPTSLLSRFNHVPAGTRIAVPPDFARTIAVAMRVAAESDGAFDPAIGRLVALWGIAPHPPRPAPSAREIAEARAASGWQRLDHDPATGTMHQPGGLWLDLSGVAKGHAVDAVADLLTERGIRHALVEIGGELAGRGVRPDGEPWWVDLETPPGCMLAPIRVALHDIAVATSGAYVKGAHLLDPRTGSPAATTLSVSVIAGDAATADAWATALAVLPVEQAIARADACALAARIVTVQGGERLSARLRAMLAD